MLVRDAFVWAPNFNEVSKVITKNSRISFLHILKHWAFNYRSLIGVNETVVDGVKVICHEGHNWRSPERRHHNNKILQLLQQITPVHYNVTVGEKCQNVARIMFVRSLTTWENKMFWKFAYLSTSAADFAVVEAEADEIAYTLCAEPCSVTLCPPPCPTPPHHPTLQDFSCCRCLPLLFCSLLFQSCKRIPGGAKKRPEHSHALWAELLTDF